MASDDSSSSGKEADGTVRASVKLPLKKLAARVLRSEDIESPKAAESDIEELSDTTEEHSQEGEKSNRWELIASLLESGDRAKSNVIKLLGREVRQAIEALELHKDVLNLLQNHSLEIQASIHLKPLDEQGSNDTLASAEQNSTAADSPADPTIE